MTAKKTDAPEPEAAPEAPADTVQVTNDGLRASVTSYGLDGAPVSASTRDATLAEQVAYFAPQVLQQALGIIPGAATGSVTTDGGVVTLSLLPH